MTNRHAEEDEAPPLGAGTPRREEHPAPRVRQTTLERMMDDAVREFLAARNRAYGKWLDRLPQTYDGEKIHQKTIRDHFIGWLEEHGPEMTMWAITTFFRTVYLYEQDENAYSYPPHSNLSNWMKIDGRRRIRQEKRWRADVERMKERAR